MRICAKERRNKTKTKLTVKFGNEQYNSSFQGLFVKSASYFHKLHGTTRNYDLRRNNNIVPALANHLV